MENSKDISIEVIKKLPDTCTFEDIMYEINVVAQIMEGLDDAKEGRTISTEELLKQVKEWGK